MVWLDFQLRVSEAGIHMPLIESSGSPLPSSSKLLVNSIPCGSACEAVSWLAGRWKLLLVLGHMVPPSSGQLWRIPLCPIFGQKELFPFRAPLIQGFPFRPT